MADPLETLRRTIAAELCQPVSPAISTMVEELRRRHPRGVLGVLFYGSCLRRGMTTEGVLDFYLLVENYREFYGRALPALGNAVLPPNVFYAECPWDGGTLRAKYAVISLAQFRAGTSRRSLQSTLWARFAQPVRLVAVRDAAVSAEIERAIAEAVVAMVEAALPLLPGRFTAADLWQAAFRATYGAELRSEGPGRAQELYLADAERYDAVTPLALAAAGHSFRVDEGGRIDLRLPPALQRRGKGRWRLRRRLGKLLNLLRLVKAALTFSGGLDYVLWKIERHSGVRVAASPWQRRHPLLAAPFLAWRVYRQGGFR